MSDRALGNRNLILIAAAVLGLSIIVGGYLLGDGLRRATASDGRRPQTGRSAPSRRPAAHACRSASDCRITITNRQGDEPSLR